LPKVGLGIVPEIESVERTFSTNGNKTVCNSLVKMSFELIDQETGEKITKVFYGEANDTTDKATAKAITECQKRFEFKLFHVSSFEDKDNDANHIETPATIAKKAMIMGDTAYSKLMERIRTGDSISIETVEQHYTLTKTVKEVLQKAIDEASQDTQA
jgi:hypothetical protein